MSEITWMREVGQTPWGEWPWISICPSSVFTITPPPKKKKKNVTSFDYMFGHAVYYSVHVAECCVFALLKTK